MCDLSFYLSIHRAWVSPIDRDADVLIIFFFNLPLRGVQPRADAPSGELDLYIHI